MGGGLMQIVSGGEYSDYILGNPQITYFKSVYRRHTNFAIECVEQMISGSRITENTNTEGSVTISKSADLLSKIYIICPQTTQGINGYELVDTAEMIIGGALIDKQTSEWNKVWNELTTPLSKADGLKYMTGGFNSTNVPGTGQSKIIFPLNFWFCRNNGLALPLISLQYHDIKLKLKWGINSDINRDAYAARSSNCEVWTDLIFLDQGERERFAESSHEYLIEQLQIVDSSLESPSLKFKMNSVNNFVKELIWVEGNTGSSSIINEKFNIFMNGIERFSERDKEYFTLNQPMVHHTSIPGFNIKETDSPIMLSTHLSVGTSDLNTANTYNPTTTKIADGIITINSNQGTTPKIGDIVMIKETTATAANQTGPIISTIISITGETVFGLSSDTITVGGHFHLHIIARAFNPKSRCSDYSKNIYVYSFSLNPEEHQPSGICNFTRLDDVKLSIDSSKTIDKIYAVNYNVLRISNGLAALVYT
jgi:hypothetical protein